MKRLFFYPFFTTHWQWQTASFFVALLIYGLFGSPTPDAFTWVEAVTGLFLLFSVSPHLNAAGLPGRIFILYGATIPVALSFIGRGGQGAVARDFAAFLFLCLPMLYRIQADNKKMLIFGISTIGTLFALRSLITADPLQINFESWNTAPPDLLYLPNSPEVLFTGLFCLSCALFRDGWAVVQRSVLALVTILIVASMVMMMQRANLAYTLGFACIAYAGLWFRQPRAALILSVCLIPAAILLYPFAADISGQLLMKSQMVGLNSRIEEWRQVISLTTSSPVSFLFGLGWGAEFENPAVAGLRVNFTHSLISSLLLKTGICGVISFIVYGFALLNPAWGELKRKPLWLLMLAGPLLIGILLYASYKSLGFGLMLLLLSSFGKPKRVETDAMPVP